MRSHIARCVRCGNYQLLLMGVSTSKKPNCKQIIKNNADNIELLNINYYVCCVYHFSYTCLLCKYLLAKYTHIQEKRRKIEWNAKNHEQTIIRENDRQINKQTKMPCSMFLLTLQITTANIFENIFLV